MIETGSQDARRAELLERLRILKQSLDETAADRKPVELDQTAVGRLSRVDAIQAQQLALAAARRQQLEIRKVEAAIRRLERGGYGFCIACDEEIGPERLAADPATPTCIACASGGG